MPLPEHEIATLQIDSPIRFALIGPGKPYPTVVLSSKSGNSDLVGFYSLIELGLQQLLPGASNGIGTRPRSILETLLYPDRESGEANAKLPFIGSVDIWFDPTADGSDTRREMYSLVFDSFGFKKTLDRLSPELRDGLQNQIISVVRAYQRKDEDSMRYGAQILTTILGLIAQESERARRRTQRSRKVLTNLLFGYIGIIAIGMMLFFVFDKR